MSEVVQFHPRRTGSRNERLGGCPHCGRNDGWLNVGRDEWVVCNRHQVKWFMGSNLFSDWRHETEEDWLRNRYKLDRYMTVEPVIPEPQAVDERIIP